MNSIDIRTGEAGKIDTIVFADVRGNANAISFNSGEMDFIHTDEEDYVDLTLSDSDAYNLYLAMCKAFEMGLIKPPVVKAPAGKRATTAKK